MSPLEVLLQAVNRLDRLDIPYMLSGALATSFYGKPRSTHDIDLLVEIGEADIDRLCEAFKDDFYISKEMMLEALRLRSMFNLIHNETATKVDLWMLEDSPFDRERFSRRTVENLEGSLVHISTPEDLIIVKLDWFKRTDIHKHYEDALGIIQIQRDSLGVGYIRAWCERQSTAGLFDRLLDAAG